MAEPVFGANTQIFWAVVLAIEAFLIIFSNIISIRIFLEKRFTAASKSSYLLVNLTFADLLVGLAAVFNSIEVIAYNKFLFVPCNGIVVNEISLTLAVFASFASLNSLALIALDRTLAIFAPWSFRRAKKRYYFFAITTSWCISLPFAFIMNLADCTNMIRHLLFIVIISSAIIVMIVSYTLIFIKTKLFSTVQSNFSLRNSIRLSKTMQMATCMALGTWLPRFVAGRMGIAARGVVLANVYMALVVLMYSNSFANFFIYALRISQFRKELYKMFQFNMFKMRFSNRIEVQAQRSQENIQERAASSAS